MASVRVKRRPVATSKGRRTATERKLNISWTVAPAKARSSSSPSPRCPIETMVFVTEVPMLAPMMTKMASLTSMTVGTSPTTIEVVVEEDWRRTVARMPMHSPATGFSMSPMSAPAVQPEFNELVSAGLEN